MRRLGPAFVGLMILVGVMIVFHHAALDVPHIGSLRLQQLTSFYQSADSVQPATDLKVAVAITILKMDREAGGWLDGVAVFAKSVQTAVASSKYSHDLVALIHPDTEGLARQYVEPLGFRIIVEPVPVKPEEILNENFRKEIIKSGCCGISELIKIGAYKLTAYDFVLHLDVDTLMLGPVDELYELNRTLLYTKDMDMLDDASRRKPNGRDLAMIQGGFVLLRPEPKAFDDIMAIVRKGDWGGQGWGKTGVGYGYGGPTFQGVLPYYWQYVRHLVGTPAYLEVDNCKYNVMNEMKRPDRYDEVHLPTT